MRRVGSLVVKDARSRTSEWCVLRCSGGSADARLNSNSRSFLSVRVLLKLGILEPCVDQSVSTLVDRDRAREAPSPGVQALLECGLECTAAVIWFGLLWHQSIHKSNHPAEVGFRIPRNATSAPNTAITTPVPIAAR